MVRVTFKVRPPLGLRLGTINRVSIQVEVRLCLRLGTINRAWGLGYRLVLC